MPEVNIRPAVESDIQRLFELDHSYQTDTVWQLDRISSENIFTASFREIKLPRTIKVDYPHSLENLNDGLARSQLLVASVDEALTGYVKLEERLSSNAVWIADLVVDVRERRKGIGRALMVAVQKWAFQRRFGKIVMEMQSKNYPAICFAIKTGYQFSGFHDHYYINQDIALFFARITR